MTRYTEDDLRTVLDEISQGMPVQAPDVTEIARRGRAVRRRRTAVGGAALTGAAAAAVAFLPGSGPDPAVTAARVEPTPVITNFLGMRLPLLHTETHRVLGERVEVVFRPGSVHTAYTIHCEDPQSWVLMRLEHNGGQGHFGRCGTGSEVDGQFDELSAGPGWVGQEQTFEIWVFPADAPIADPATAPGGDDPYSGCEEADRTRGTCDGEYTPTELLNRPELAEQVVARQEGPAWTVDVYDNPPE